MGAYTGAGMYPQMVYHADVRAREMELAAERQVGCSCSALGRMISRVITKCNGREGRISRYDEKMDYAMAYAPAQTCYVRPTARNVTLSASDHHPAHAHAVQPEPPRAHATTLPGTPSFPSTGAPPHGGGAGARKPKKKKKKKQVRFTPSGPVPMDAPPPHAQHHTATTAGGGGAAGTAAGVIYHHGAAQPPPSHSPAPPVHGRQGGHGYAYGYGYGRYAPSPLPRWEMLGTPRRPEYFSSEYRWYYPTPVREGIYSIATDANGRLSTIFSEENPNACTIV